MPARDDLLNPIPGANPGGESLRYAALLDKIKEARREEDDVPQGEWQYERKTADYPLVMKLAGDALATRSKDLQIAVWMAEALLKQEGFAGLRAGLEAIRGLIDKFWEHLYPELEDGDAELRAAPLDWLGSRMDSALRSQPLTRRGTNWFQFKEARAVGYETDADTPAKLEARTAAISEGKMSGEEWDKDFQATPKAFYADLEGTLDGLLETLSGLSEQCEGKFGAAAPSFAPIRVTLEEIRHAVHGLLQNKRESEPDEAAPPAEMPAEGGAEEAASGAAARRARPPAGAAEPVDKDDAYRRVIAAAAYLRCEDPASPVSYLLLRALRWGELRAAGPDVDQSLLDPPPTELRQALRKASLEGDWQRAMEVAEGAAGMPSGRGWLDLQRYADQAAYQLSYYQVQAAIRAETKALLADYPGLRQAVLLDDTPAANQETQAWIDEIAPQRGPELTRAAPEEQEVEAAEAGSLEQRRDANDLALEAARRGRPEEAIDILAREAAAEQSGRRRFQRRLQLAQLCMSLGHERIAGPILEQLAAELDSRNLETWEAPAMVAQPLVLLFRCLAKLDGGADRRQEVYNRICRLDPSQALACGR